jgi:rod shape-determining protein MreD
MPTLLSTSRRESDVHAYPVYVYILAPFLAVLLQGFLPHYFPRITVINLPLIVTVYFAMQRRSPIAGTLTGTLIGLAQDALTSRPIGINGIANAIIGYLAASLGLRIDVDNHGLRLVLNFVSSLLHSFLTVVILRRLLQFEYHWNWVHELVTALVTSILAVILFAALDRTRLRE